MSVIAFIAGMDQGEQARWVEQLALLLPEEHIEVDRAALGAHAADVEVAIVANPSPGSLAGFPNLQFVQSLWAGVERLVVEQPLPPHVRIARLVDADMTRSMVASVVAHVLSLHLQHHRYAAAQLRGEWVSFNQPQVSQRRVGILGLGQLGSAAALALADLGFPVSGWSRILRRVDAVTCRSGGAGLAQLLASSDIVVNLLPLTPDTEAILDAAAFAQLPVGAGLVNVGRGGHVDEAALLEALRSGQVGHAVLDVFAREPLPFDHPFWTHEQVTVLPHVAGPSSVKSACTVAADNVRAYRRGGELRHLVDRSVGY